MEATMSAEHGNHDLVIESKVMEGTLEPQPETRRELQLGDDPKPKKPNIACLYHGINALFL